MRLMAKKRGNRKDAKSTETPPNTESSERQNQTSRWRDPLLIAVIGLIGTLVIAGATLLVPWLESWLRDGPAPIPVPPPNEPHVGSVKSEPPVEALSPIPGGLLIFVADEWDEQVLGDRKEIVRVPGSELSVELRKVGIGISDPSVERQLVYSKRQEDALEMQYEFAGGTEIGVHLVLHYLRPGFSDYVPLDPYAKGDIFLRIKPLPIDGDRDGNDLPPVRFALKLERESTSFWDEIPHSSAEGRLHEPSGWWDVRIPIQPYIERMKQAASTESDAARLDGVLIYFADRYASPRQGRFGLNAIVLTNEAERQSQVD
jgi:hypothetical protein